MSEQLALESTAKQIIEKEARWQSANEQFLIAALAWLRLKLTNYLKQTTSAVGNVTEKEINQAAATMNEAAAAVEEPAFVFLSRALGLTPFEQNTLLLCSAVELDSRIADLCALVQGNQEWPFPTFALVLTIFDDPAWEILSPKRPLRFWGLVEVNQPATQTLVNSPIQADERIVNYLKGLDYLDDRLTPYMIRGPVEHNHSELPQSQQTIANRIIEELRGSAAADDLPVIQLLGIDKVSKQLVAQHAASELGLSLSRMAAGLLPSRSADLITMARLWQREARLLPLALYLEASEVEESDLASGPASSLKRFLAHSEGVTFLDTRDVVSQPGRRTVTFDISKPTDIEQQSSWAGELGNLRNGSPAQLAAQFNLSAPAISDIAQSVLEKQGSPDSKLPEKLWAACLIYTRPRLDTLAQRLNPIATWENIVLPQDQLELLHQISGQIRQRYTVYDEWGFRQFMNRGLGIVALFAGESGTGKTMAAEVIANELNLNLYRIDLSAVVSKYIGETEKNLRQLFDAAEDGGAILFFDEADALFGKRSQVRDSHDRYANIEVNYLLQRLEAFQGLAVLATNMKSALDEGFTRRIRFVVNFPVPETEARKRMWQLVFPAETPLEELNYDWLARFRVTGGSIHNAALNAAFLAADVGSSVTMPLILGAIRTELLKSERLINEEDFVWDVES